MYEPGMQKGNNNTKNAPNVMSGLTPLKSVDQKVKLTEAEYKNTHNLVNLQEDNSDESIDDA
jgi:hypothetical protein